MCQAKPPPSLIQHGRASPVAVEPLDVAYAQRPGGDLSSKQHFAPAEWPAGALFAGRQRERRQSHTSAPIFIFRRACATGPDSIVAERRDRPYRSRRIVRTGSRSRTRRAWRRDGTGPGLGSRITDGKKPQRRRGFWSANPWGVGGVPSPRSLDGETPDAVIWFGRTP